MYKYIIVILDSFWCSSTVYMYETSLCFLLIIFYYKSFSLCFIRCHSTSDVKQISTTMTVCLLPILSRFLNTCSVTTQTTHWVGYLNICWECIFMWLAIGSKKWQGKIPSSELSCKYCVYKTTTMTVLQQLYFSLL